MAKNKRKRNKLSKRRALKKKEYASWLEHQRMKAWMTHEMIDEDLKLIGTNVGKEKEEG